MISGANSMEMIPTLIEQGFRIILVVFDVWGISQMVHGALTQARKLAKGSTPAETNGETPSAFVTREHKS